MLAARDSIQHAAGASSEAWKALRRAPCRSGREAHAVRSWQCDPAADVLAALMNAENSGMSPAAHRSTAGLGLPISMRGYRLGAGGVSPGKSEGGPEAN